MSWSDPPELPLLDNSKCTGCSDCVQVCPVDCLVMRGFYPWLLRPRDCVACALCVLICPEQALRMQPSSSE
jgi:ferredoxin